MHDPNTTPTPEYFKEFEKAMEDLESREYFEVPEELHDRDFFSVKRIGADPNCNRMENTEFFNELMKENYGDFLTRPLSNWENDLMDKVRNDDLLKQLGRESIEAAKGYFNMSEPRRMHDSVDLIENDKVDKICEEVQEMISQDNQVSNPAHYQSNSGLEVIDVIEAFKLNFNIGNVLKYIVRADKKGRVVDLKKAVWYLQREIMLQEESQQE